MEELDILILKYLSKGLKIGNIPKQLKEDESIVASKSSIEKRLTIIKKLQVLKNLSTLRLLPKSEIGFSSYMLWLSLIFFEK